MYAKGRSVYIFLATMLDVLATEVRRSDVVGVCQLNVVLDPTMPVDNFELRGAKQVVRVVNVGEGEPEPVDRFAAVALELEDL